MTEFEAQRTMPAGPDAVFDVVSNLNRLTEWLPHAVRVRPTGDGGGATPMHADVEPRGIDTHGLARVRRDQMRVEWGSEDGPDYAGWLQVMGDEPDRSSVMVHLSFLGDQPETHGGGAADELRGWLDDGLARLERLVAESPQPGSTV